MTEADRFMPPTRHSAILYSTDRPGVLKLRTQFRQHGKPTVLAPAIQFGLVDGLDEDFLVRVDHFIRPEMQVVMHF